MPPSTSRTLEITVISAEALSHHQKLIKRSCFATVRTDSQNFGTTQIDERGGSYPCWNQKISLNLPLNVSFMTVGVHCGSFSRNKIVGTATVPVSDFTGGYVPERYLHFLSYRLRDVRGERNGIINLSVKVVVSDFASTSQTRLKVQVAVEKTNFGGDDERVAIGIPIWNGDRSKFG